jgi:hypothetical protein
VNSAEKSSKASVYRVSEQSFQLQGSCKAEIALRDETKHLEQECVFFPAICPFVLTPRFAKSLGLFSRREVFIMMCITKNIPEFQIPLMNLL